MTTKGRLYVFVVLLVMVLLALWLRNGKQGNAKTGIDPAEASSSTRTVGFKRNTTFLEYTKHAKCRMACRHITKSEVEDIMKNGSVNYKKSDIHDRPCPTYALEGLTKQDNQHVRIVFAQCENKTKVVTCIDLEEEFNCDCN